MLTNALLRAAALAIGVGAAAAALAQAAAPPLPPALTPVAPPAAAPALTDGQIELGRQLVAASGLQPNFNNIILAMMEQIGRSVSRTRPDYADKLRAVLQANEGDFLKNAAQMNEIAARIIASRLGEAEMKDAIAFFGSPSGKKYIAAQPQILDAVIGASEEWRKELSVTMFEKVRAEMKKMDAPF